MQARDGIDALPLFLDAHRSLSEQLDEVKAKHSGLRAILLTTPNNPTGEVLPAKGESVRWTRSHLEVVIIQQGRVSAQRGSSSSACSRPIN